MISDLSRKPYFKRMVATIVSSIAFPFFSGSLLGFFFFCIGFCCICSIISDDVFTLSRRDQIKASIERLSEFQLQALLDPATLKRQIEKYKEKPDGEFSCQLLLQAVEDYRTKKAKQAAWQAEHQLIAQIYADLESSYFDTPLTEYFDQEKFDNFIAQFKERPHFDLYRTTMQELVEDHRNTQTAATESSKTVAAQKTSPAPEAEKEVPGTGGQNQTGSPSTPSPKKPPKLSKESFREKIHRSMNEEAAKAIQVGVSFFAEEYFKTVKGLRKILTEAEVCRILMDESDAFLSGYKKEALTPRADSKKTSKESLPPSSQTSCAKKAPRRTTVM